MATRGKGQPKAQVGQQQEDKQRQEELLARFPDGTAIGRAFVENLIHQQGSAKNPEKYKPFLSPNDMELLRAYLNEQSQEEKDKYSVYAKLYEALVQALNIMTLYSQTFEHGVFKALHILNSASMTFKVLPYLDQVPEPAPEKAYASLAQNSISLIEANLMYAWETLITPSVRKLNALAYALEQFRRIAELDFNILLPNFENIRQEYNLVTETALVTVESFEQYQAFLDNSKDGRPRSWVNISREAYDIVTRVSLTPFEPTTTIQDDTQKQLKQVIESRGIIDRITVDRVLTAIQNI